MRVYATSMRRLTNVVIFSTHGRALAIIAQNLFTRHCVGARRAVINALTKLYDVKKSFRLAKMHVPLNTFVITTNVKATHTQQIAQTWRLLRNSSPFSQKVLRFSLTDEFVMCDKTKQQQQKLERKSLFSHAHAHTCIFLQPVVIELVFEGNRDANKKNVRRGES